MATHSIFLPGESQGQRSLVGYGPQGGKEVDVTDANQLARAQRYFQAAFKTEQTEFALQRYKQSQFLQVPFYGCVRFTTDTINTNNSIFEGSEIDKQYEIETWKIHSLKTEPRTAESRA